MRRQALKARLLVPVCLAAGMALYNSQAEKPVGGAEEFSLLGGFLSYKVKPTEDSLLPVHPSAVHHQMLWTLWTEA